MINNTNETIIKADAGYQLVSVYFDSEDDSSFHHKSPIIAWRITTTPSTRTTNAVIECDPIAIDWQQGTCSNEVTGIEQPDGRIFIGFEYLTLKEFYAHAIKEIKDREAHKKLMEQRKNEKEAQAKANTNSA